MNLLVRQESVSNRRRTSRFVCGLLAALGLCQTLAAAPWIVVTEIQYHPPPVAPAGAKDSGIEFIEILNREPPAVDLTDWTIEGEVRFRFPRGTTIEPGEYLVIATDPRALLEQYPALERACGPLSGRLDNDGGRIVVRKASGARVAEALYGRSGGWTPIPDGSGHTLSLIDPLLDPTRPRSWAPSPRLGGTPGARNGFRGAVPGVTDHRNSPEPGRSARRDPCINEVSPAGDPKSPEPFVEIFNPTGAAMSLAGYHLSDDTSNPRKLTIPASAASEAVPSRGFLKLSTKELGALELRGPTLVLTLTAPDGTRVVDLVHLRPAKAKDAKRPQDGKEDGKEGDVEAVALPLELAGRYPDGAPELVRLERPSPGEPNLVEVTRDLVINEILYNPFTSDEADEFLEIHNKGKARIDLGGYRFDDGVRYEFGDEASIAAGGYLVVAKDPRSLARRHGVAATKFEGPYDGTLSNRGEVVSLRDAGGRLVDRVAYADRDPWPRWADGLGSSLELVHPDLDNALGGSWAASDESGKARWQTVQYVKEHRGFRGQNLSEFQMLLLDAGECLIDDLKIMGGRRNELIPDGSFERGGAGWRTLGTHWRSAVVEEASARGKSCYRLAAEGRGNSRANHVALEIPGSLQPNERYRVSFRARWQRGSPLLLTRSTGQGLAQLTRLEVPTRLGTPGAKNSTWSRQAEPVVANLTQFPIAPSETQSVTVTARVAATNAISGVKIYHRRTDERAWSETGMTLAQGTEQSGSWTATIPPTASGTVEFYVAAQASDGRLGSFPAKAPLRTALYAVGLKLHAKLPTYTLLVSEQQWSDLRARTNRLERLGNQLSHGTFIYGNSRILHDVGFRPHGSPFTRSRSQPSKNWRIELGAERLDGRKTLMVDSQQKHDQFSLLNEKLTFWMLDTMRAPSLRQQFVYFQIPGREDGVFEDLEKVDAAFLDRCFGDGSFREPSILDSADETPRGSVVGRRRKLSFEPHTAAGLRGYLHKVDDYFEVPSGDMKYLEAFLDFKSKDPEDYRWNFPPRANGKDEDFTPLVKLIHFMDPDTTPDRVFVDNVETMVDVDQWLRVLAVRAAVNDWDSIGRGRGKNAFLYLPPAAEGRRSRWLLLPWDCDLSWRNQPRAAVIEEKFPAFRRLLEVPRYKRQYLGYVSFLAERMMSPDALSATLESLTARTGVSGSRHLSFASTRRAFILDQIPQGRFGIVDTKRVSRRGKPDLLWVTGTAPVLVQRVRLEGREGHFEAVDRGWKAAFEVGPLGGELELTALDLGGTELFRRRIRVQPRRGAVALADPEPETVLVTAERVARAPTDPGPPSGGPATPPQGPGGTGGTVPVPTPGGPGPDSSQEESPGEVQVATSGTAEVAAPGETARPEAAVLTGDTEVREVTAAAAEGDSESSRRGSSARESSGRRRLRAWDRTRDQTGTGSNAVSGGDARGEARRVAAPAQNDTTEPGESSPGGLLFWAALAAIPLLAGALLLMARLGRRGPSNAARSASPAAASPTGTRTKPPRHADRPVTAGQATVRSERPRAAAPVPEPPPTKSPPERVSPDPFEILAGDDFEASARAFRHLWRAPGKALPKLLDLLEDHRRSAIVKIRKGPKGLTFLPAHEPGTGIPLQRLAVLLLQRALGKPVAAEPTRADWEELLRARAAN